MIRDPSRRQIPFNGEAVGVIPARKASTRFPDKPLALIQGIPMVCWALRRARQAQSLKSVFVAAEDQEILEAVERCGGKAMLVKGNFKSGSDRVAAATVNLDAPVIVDIQADEPLIAPSLIDEAVALLEAHPEFDVTTAVRPIRRIEEYLDPNCVKVVMDRRGKCLYFSRASIPSQKNPSRPVQLPSGFPFFKHVGFYCFRAEALRKFTQLNASPLEDCEGLEQLRWLEYGGAIGAVETATDVPAVDTAGDIALAERYIKDNKIQLTRFT